MNASSSAARASASPGRYRPAAPPPARRRRPVDAHVYAAASLTDAFRELGRALEASHPGLTVQFNFAGSQQLALQIEQGAPADVFASADQRWMSYAAEKGLDRGCERRSSRGTAWWRSCRGPTRAHRRPAGPRAPGHQARGRGRGGAGGQVQPGNARETGAARRASRRSTTAACSPTWCRRRRT